MKVVGYQSTGSQVGDAVWIGVRGAGSLINSKSEFNCCFIVRLTLEKESNTEEDQQGERMDGATEDMWEGRMLKRRDEFDRFKRSEL